jgi:peptidoglycan/LPS O-acetylase OafA/YrhL
MFATIIPDISDISQDHHSPKATTNMTEKKKIPFDILDSIRGIASLYVAIAHCRGSLWIGGNEFMKLFPRDQWNAWDYIMFGSSMLTRLAVEFVIVFFVLSGFSIAHSLAVNKSPLGFYKRRFIRIYPSYVVALIWAGAVYFITKAWHPEWYDGSISGFNFLPFTMEMNHYLDGDVVAKNLVYLPSRGFITPFWSLTYEVIFYLLAPFLLRKLNWYAIVSILLFAFGVAMPGMVKQMGLPVYISDFLFVYNVYFVVGVLLYNYYENVATAFSKISKLQLMALMAIALAAMYGINIYYKIENTASFVASATLGSLLIIFFLKYQVRIPWLMAVGKYSYTLYITHFATIFLYLGIYWLIQKPQTPYILNYFIWMPAVFLALLVAWVQYLLVEKRTKNILQALRSKTKAKNQPAA